MAYQLYPPSIPGTLPAIQLIDENSNSSSITRKYKFIIPFKINRGVGWNEITGFSLKIKNKTLQSISTPVLTTTDINTLNLAKQTNILEFEYTLGTGANMEIVPEEYYKVQMAFIDKNNSVGYYSTVGYAKCIASSCFDVKINNTEDTRNLQANGEYTISFIDTNYDFNIISSSGLKTTTTIVNTETPYAYKYAIVHTTTSLASASIKQKKWDALNSTDVVVDYASDEILYNIDLENSFDYRVDIPYYENGINKIYYNTYLLFRLQTSNNLYIDLIYQLEQNYSLGNVEKVSLIASNNYEDGFINVTLKNIGYNNITYTLLRAKEDVQPYRWIKLGEITATDANTEYVYQDYLVEHGVKYIYAVEYTAEVNSVFYRLYSNIIVPQFEDMFLLDNSGRQLRIQYNPKVSTFKQDILEQKIDTIGGQYPFFFRNGRVKYKEFSLSGLISYQMDSNEKFLTDEELGLIRDLTHRELTDGNWPIVTIETDEITGETRRIVTPAEPRFVEEIPNYGRRSNLDDYNMYSERVFKRKVQDWLGNGEVKILKTPAEGTFLVRLMNVSLSPEDRLSRMLHNFSCQAYEIGTLNQIDLEKFGFIHDKASSSSYHWSSTLIPRPVPANRSEYENITLVPFGSEQDEIEYLGILNGQYERVRLSQLNSES